MNSQHWNQYPELWGGIECTINRVNDTYYDQLEFSGHYHRPDDIEACAALGIKALRYPVLWEKYQPSLSVVPQWDFAKSRLAMMSELRIEPIIGFVHHGSGPAFASFFNGSFENGLASYAEQFAKKFPRINYFTPVNEPLTTARFCGLYGYWFPHKADDYHFTKILLSECRGIVLAMKKIREINPDAKLIQTEDLTRIYSTPLLKYQADFENNRKWLTFDLISGNVVPDHPLFGYLLLSGITEQELAYFWENNCRPDIMGLNHYVTSERYLDHDIDKYPVHTIGSNGKHRYADVEAVRVNFPGMYGPSGLLREAWNRFHSTLAITEVHLNCHREEQLRWISEIWQTATDLRKENIDIIAVTAWALLGSFGWNKLLTGVDWAYEPGVFDVRNGDRRPLATARLLECLAQGKKFEHPVMNGDGWWKRPTRFIFDGFKDTCNGDQSTSSGQQPILAIGDGDATHELFIRACNERSLCYIELTSTSMENLENLIREHDPWAIVLTTPYLLADTPDWLTTVASACSFYGVQLLSFIDTAGSWTAHSNGENLQPENLSGQVAESTTQPLLVCLEYLSYSHNQDATRLRDAIHTSLDLLIDQATGTWFVRDGRSFQPIQQTFAREQVA